MALYQKYESELLTENGIDLSDNATKLQVELYDPEQTLQLPIEPLEGIQNFLGHYNSLTGNAFKLRYYQILALLFTEQFFADQNELDNGEKEQRTLAYWMATGSGKTLVMHLNILQYLHHFCKEDNARGNTQAKTLQIFLTTPLANLIKQHERELEPYLRKLNEIYNKLNWHQEAEDRSTSRLFKNEKSYLDLMFEKAGIYSES